MKIALPLTVLLLSLTAGNSPAGAEQAGAPKGHEPRVCVGYQPADNLWAFDRFEETHLCEPNYAFFSTHKPGGKRPFPSMVEANASCCPLPAHDILTTEHSFSENGCAINSVATGMLREGRIFKLRCTRINTERYMLGAATLGSVWGASTAAAFPWREHQVLKPADIPPAIRFGVTRRSHFEFLENGCIGDPPGSLLVRKLTKKCFDFHFQQLQFRGIAGDPPQGTAVRMFPECRYIADIFDTDSECIQ